MNPDSLLQGEEIAREHEQEQPEALPPPPPIDINAIAPEPMPMPAAQPVGLSEVLDMQDKDGKVIGHYQWAFHKDGRADSLSVVKVAKDHDGTEQVLYKTYKESAIAKQAKEEALGAQGVKEKLAAVKINEEYKSKHGDVQKYGLENQLEFQLTGFVVVMIVLSGLWAVIGAVSYFIKAFGLGKAQAPGTQAAAPAAAGKTIHPGIGNEQFVAIISAAAAHAIGKPVNVVKFKPLNTMDWTWAIQGRVSLHSHKKT